MQQDIAERKIRGLQKEFFTRVEQHPALMALPADEFNTLRKRVFRGTFSAYRLGVVGIEQNGTANLYDHFFGWLDGAMQYLDPPHRKEVAQMCFFTALEAYRIGAMVAETRRRTPGLA